MKVLFINHNNILSDVIPHFEPVTELGKAERVVVWSDVTQFERTVVEMAKAKGIPTLVLQHGRSGTSRYYPPFNMKIAADKLLVFGEKDKRDLITAGQDPNKIKIVGTTLFSHLKPRVPHKGVNVLFSPDHWDREVDENVRTAKELRKLKGVNIITKIVDGNDETLYDNPIKTSRADESHIDVCADVLATADILVALSEGTLELLAEALNIPVVIMSEWEPKSFGGDERYKNGYRRIISPAAKKATIKDLRKIIYQQLKNPTELREERKRVIIDEGGFGLNSLELIKNEIVH